MNNKYYLKYFESINYGLLNSIYHLSKVRTEPDIFFLTLKKALKSLRSDKKKIYLFGNGASATFANHTALDF